MNGRENYADITMTARRSCVKFSTEKTVEHNFPVWEK